MDGVPGAARLAALVDRWRFTMLLALQVGAFFLAPLMRHVPLGDAFMVLVHAGIFVAVVRLAREAVPWTLAGKATIALWALATLAGGSTLTGITLILSLVLVGWITACTLGLLLYEAKADGDALAGAVFGYFLMAQLWAVLYGALLFSAPGAIALPEGSVDPSTDLLYFSLVTITTLGYGDILPVSPFARILAGLEAAVGTLYLAVLIGRIVGALKRPARRQKDGADAPAGPAR
ncbi:MAG: ion channel [Pseudomonadota bacterium]